MDENKKNNQRIYWLDIAKGIGIILVILAHSIFPFVQQIDYFHMPLFFILAGFTFKAKQVKDFLLSKVNRIFVPYIFWAILSGLISLIPHGYGGVFNGPLWFLQNIFVALILIFIGYLSKSYIYILIIFSVSILSSIIPDFDKVLPFQLGLGATSALFIYLGTLCGKRIKKSSRRNGFLILIISLIIFCLLSVIARNSGLSGSYVSKALFKENYILSFTLAIAGSFAVVGFSILLSRQKILEWFGKNSLVIMCVHFPLCMYLDGALVKLPYFTTSINKLIIASFEWVIVIIFSVLMCIICKKFIPRLTGYSSLIK